MARAEWRPSSLPVPFVPPTAGGLREGAFPCVPETARCPSSVARRLLFRVDKAMRPAMSGTMDAPVVREATQGLGHWGIRFLSLIWRTLLRMWGRDVMLYVGGVSFFAMLAVFPALAIVLGVYSILLTPEQALAQASAFAQILPPAALTLFQS